MPVLLSSLQHLGLVPARGVAGPQARLTPLMDRAAHCPWLLPSQWLASKRSLEEVTSGSAGVLLQEKHVETAKLLLGEGRELNSFVSQLLDDIANLKAMLHAISIGKSMPCGSAGERLCEGVAYSVLHGSCMCTTLTIVHHVVPQHAWPASGLVIPWDVC